MAERFHAGGVPVREVVCGDHASLRPLLILALLLGPLLSPTFSANATAWLDKGLKALKSGNVAAAEQAFSKAIDIDPSLAQAYWDRGQARMRQGNLDGARQDLDHWIEYDPKYALLRADLDLLIFSDEREPRRAKEEELARAAESEGSHLSAFRHLAVAYALTVDRAEEDRLADVLIAAWTRCNPRPGYPAPLKLYLAQGQDLFLKNQHEDAAAAYLQAARYCPWSVEAHYNAGLILGEYQRYPQACQAMKRARALFPEGPEAQEADGMLITWEFLK